MITAKRRERNLQYSIRVAGNFNNLQSANNDSLSETRIAEVMGTKEAFPIVDTKAKDAMCSIYYQDITKATMTLRLLSCNKHF